MTFDELKVHVLRLQQIARDTTRPLKTRTAAATELGRLRKLAGKMAPPTPAQPAQPVDPNWIWRKTYQLEMAAIDGRHEDVVRLRSEFVAKGLDVPAHKGYIPPIKDVPPLPERPAAPLPLIDERAAALHAKRTHPVAGERVVEWGEW